VADKPDAFLKERAEQFNRTATTISYAFIKITITRKISYLAETGGVSGANKADSGREASVIDETGVHTWLQWE
jgi:hypothetical protein